MGVYAPFQERNAPKLPVFVWIQAGGFNALTTPNYNGTGLIRAADMGIVVVTFNYRVGAHGFLAGEQVKKGGSLNNGLKDQIKALEWVQKHIGKVRCLHLSTGQQYVLTDFSSLEVIQTMSSWEVPAQALLP